MLYGMISHTDTLPESPEELKELVRTLSSKVEHYEREIPLLYEQLRLFRAKLYGRKSEKRIVDDAQETLPLFDLPEPGSDEEVKEEAEEEAEEEVQVAAHTRKKGGRRPLPEHLPRIEQVHDIEDKVCSCGCELKKIGEDVSEQLDIVPAKVRVIRHIRPKYVCPSCEGLEDEGPTIRIAPVPPQVVPKSSVSAGLLAYLLTSKFVDHTPFYRQEKQLLRLGVKVSRTSMSRWAMRAAEVCQPVMNLMEEEVLAGRYVQIDETTVQVLKEPGREAGTKSYMWLFRRGDPGRRVLVYQYHPTRSGEVAREFLGDFKGTVQTDGYAGYDFLDHQEAVRHIGCWAHVRRKFVEVVNGVGKQRKRRGGAADKALGYIRKLYALEKAARTGGYSPEEVYDLRQRKARPMLAEFEKWLRRKREQTPPKGLLGKAVGYALKQWSRLTGYLEDPTLLIDNNLAENGIRPFVVGRKNWLFAGTPEGARASALLYSLIETAKANDVEPYAYLRHLFEAVPVATTLEAYEALLPWNIKSLPAAEP